MDIEVIKKLIKNCETRHTSFINNAMIAERYYRNKTDVLLQDKK
jgi:hypothetical protein